jgi:dTDP-4-dehydrorhamnose reductase
MKKERIIVTGARGQLGQALIMAVSSENAAAHNEAFDTGFASREVLPLDNHQSVRTYFEADRPAYCINCAAYTAVDKAESDKETAFRVNGDAVGELAAICKEYDTRLIHISTDYVFDGNSAIPLKETDPTGPLNTYGASKLQGEFAAMKNNPAATVILRTSWVYSEFGNNFVKTMMRLMKEKESIRVVDDQIGSPTYAADLAATILQIVAANTFIPGIFHYSNEGEISWYQFALAIKELTGSACRVEPLPTAQYPTAARRPHYSLLDKTRIRQTYGITIPAWKDSLSQCIKNLQPRC